jgi:EAL domain-containing protein (putative c-di-GMP-specific phosphodiesterase class I)
VVTLNGGRLVGVEAALNWQHPQLGMLSNEQCVQAAERTGVVHEVGQWLLRTAAEQAVCWQQRTAAKVPPMMINLTPSQAQDPDLVARVRAVLEETGLAPAELELRAPVTTKVADRPRTTCACSSSWASAPDSTTSVAASAGCAAWQTSQRACSESPSRCPTS